MGDRYRGPPRPQYRDKRDERRYRDNHNDRYADDRRYDHYDRYDHYERPRSRSPPRPRHERFDDRPYDRNDGYRRNDEYNFRGAAERDPRGGGDTYRPQPPQSEFTFRPAPGPGGPAPKFPPRRQRSPAPAPEPAPARAKNSRREQGKRGPPGNHGGKAGAGARGGFRMPPPHQRDILRRQEGSRTPEQLYGMNSEGQARFKEANFSTSEDSGSESGEIDDSAMDDGEGPRKRVKADVVESDAQAAPKWSNPEYFTALPPPESGLGPKKDIVQVIRKAKIEAAPKQDASNAVKENADFISFNMDDENDGFMKLDSISLSDAGADVAPPKKQKAPKNAPTSPKKPKKQANGEPNGDVAHKKKHKPSKDAPGPPLESRIQANIEPQEDPAPTKRAFKQFDPDAAPPPPPQEIDALMGMADRMAPTKKLPTKPPPTMPPPAKLPAKPEPVAGPSTIPAPQQSSEPKGKKRKATEISKGLGDVVTEWISNGTNPTPWCTVDHTRTANVGFRLHKEIADFYEFVRPHDYEEAVRRDLIQRVERAVRTFRNGLEGANGIEIRSFGSFASGVYLPTADMDLVAISPQYLQTGRKVFCQTPSKLHKLGRHLVDQNIALPGTLTAVTRAKVPIVKFTEKRTGIKVDISFENDTGLIALKTFADWKAKYPAMSIIVVLIKQMLAMRGLNEVYLGGLGGFSIICLVVSLMQHMPEIQSGNIDPNLHYSDLLLNFLDLYGNKFNLQTTGIIMEPPGYFDKIRQPHARQNDNGLTIIDPNKPENDISGGSNKVATVFDCFRKAHSEIQQRLAQIYSGENVEESILGCVLAGNYTSFITQRNRLSNLHRGQAISPVRDLAPADESDSLDEIDHRQKPKRGPSQRGRPGRGRGRGGGRGAANGSARGPPSAPAPAPAHKPPPEYGRRRIPLPQRPTTNGADFGAPKRRR